MSSHPQSSSFQFSIDDCDLDDAELWAVIDSAAASSRSRKPLLAIKNTNHFPSRNPRFSSKDETRVLTEGEVVQEEHWPHRRPPKLAKLADHRVMVVKNSPRNLTASSPSPTAYSSPYSTPGSGKYSVKEVSPVIESPPSSSENKWQSEEKENLRTVTHSLSGRFPSVAAFKQYQNAAMAILEKTDYTMISGSPFIKKSGWRKISFYFNLSFEIRDKSIEYDENRNVQRAEFVVRAYMQGGRFSDGWGSCERREKRFMKPNHDIPSTAETRAKNKACQDLLGIGEYRPGVKV